MPQISEFYGITIYMYYEDHNPPHFHAVYGEDEALVDIVNGSIYKGFLPPKQVKLVIAWCEIHKDELLQDWEKSKESQKLLKIDPLR